MLFAPKSLQFVVPLYRSPCVVRPVPIRSLKRHVRHRCASSLGGPRGDAATPVEVVSTTAYRGPRWQRGRRPSGIWRL